MSLLHFGRLLYLAILVTALILITSLVGSLAFGRETHTREPVWNGERASAPIPPSMHIKNEGGSDGAGECVPSSLLCNGLYQQVPGLENGKQSLFWRTAKSRPGGYSPNKLIPLVRETLPGEKYASIESCDGPSLDRLSRQGYPIGAVMAYGDRYPGRISHMVSLVHYREGGNACVVDNNFPGEYSWMKAVEYLSRFRANGSWAFLWTRLPAPVQVALGLTAAALISGLLVLGALALCCAAGVVLAPDPAPTEGWPA